MYASVLRFESNTKDLEEIEALAYFLLNSSLSLEFSSRFSKALIASALASFSNF